jgi:hypothetical protein
MVAMEIDSLSIPELLLLSTLISTFRRNGQQLIAPVAVFLGKEPEAG